jgi:hypothetical protein
MLYSGRATVAAAGTKVALASTRTMASWVTCVGDISNAGTVYVGGDNVQNSSGGAMTYIGHPLVKPAAGGQPNFINIREVGGPPIYDLSLIYVDADTNGDSITFNYGRR